ncbi:MAG: hypothetical protein QM278_06830 [Pseudomonadota bacterium]|nr:hypothetical protein [Pseudomonadota bacterium]
MARNSEITSTEKLLRLIRGRREAVAPVTEDEGPERVAIKKRGLRFPSPRLISLQKTSVIGVDIGHNRLRMVKTAKTPGGQWRIADHKSLPLPLDTPRDSSEFRAFLRAALASISGPEKKADLWAIMSAARVEVRHIRIPKVPKNQISNAVYWTVKKESHFDDKEMIFDYELQGEVIEQGIAKLAAMAYTAPRKEIEALKDLFARVGRPLTGISIVPFSLQNLFRAGLIPSREGAVASLFIGNDFSRIDIYAGDNLAMTRGIKAGFSSMVEALVDGFNERGRGLTAPPALTFEQGRKILRTLGTDAPPLGEDDVGYELSKEEIFSMIEPALERLVRQAERTFEHFTATFAGERMSRMFVSGVINLSPPFIEYISSQLGLACEILDPMSQFALALGMETGDGAADSLAERIAFGPALGMAFSGNDHTPNFVFTYREKETAASVARINMAVFAVFIVAVVLCTGVFAFQKAAVARKRAAIQGLETRMAALGPAVDRDVLSRMVVRARERHQLCRGYAARYLGMVFISELVELTPANIHFIDLKLTLGPLRAAATPAAAPAAAPASHAAPAASPLAGIVVEGLIFGNRQEFEIALAHYVMVLEASPIFQQVTIEKNVVEPFAKSEVLHFVLKIGSEARIDG